MKTRLVKSAPDSTLEEVMRLQLIYGKSRKEIAEAIGAGKTKTRELMIAATYYGLGMADGSRKR